MIRLTSVLTRLTDDAQKRLEEFENAQDRMEESPWERMGISNPEPETDTNPASIDFGDDDYITVEALALVKPSDINIVFDRSTGGAQVYMDSAITFDVKESAEEILRLMEMSETFWGKLKALFNVNKKDESRKRTT